MTFEHEECIHGAGPRDEQRKLLEDQGYIRLFSDLKAWTKMLEKPNSTEFFEDWWINPQLVDQKVLEAQDKEIYTFEAIEKLRTVLGNTNDYQAQHVCSRSFPSEYRLFWDQQDAARWPQLKLQITHLFEQFNSRKAA